MNIKKDTPNCFMHSLLVNIVSIIIAIYAIIATGFKLYPNTAKSPKMPQ